jgi:hypothetical protein
MCVYIYMYVHVYQRLCGMYGFRVHHCQVHIMYFSVCMACIVPVCVTAKVHIMEQVMLRFCESLWYLCACVYMVYV